MRPLFVARRYREYFVHDGTASGNSFLGLHGTSWVNLVNHGGVRWQKSHAKLDNIVQFQLLATIYGGHLAELKNLGKKRRPVSNRNSSPTLSPKFKNIPQGYPHVSTESAGSGRVAARPIPSPLVSPGKIP